ncbi:MAG TPA: SRPBCC family protein [Mycobacteriales bacterium]|nr:SRPBCC family protein [Mycobacteriales bacterium]
MTDGPAHATAETTIEAPADAVWQVLTDFPRWPEWSPGVTAMHIDGPVAVGTTFRWRSGPSRITSTITDVDPGRSIAWTGRTLGISAVHRWEVVSAGERTVVRTEETWRGLVPRLLRARAQRMLETSLQSGVVALGSQVVTRRAAPG